MERNKTQLSLFRRTQQKGRKRKCDKNNWTDNIYAKERGKIRDHKHKSQTERNETERFTVDCQKQFSVYACRDL